MSNDKIAKWMIELKDNLKMKQNMHIKIFLISKKCFNKYIQEVFNTNKNQIEITQSHYNYYFDNNILKNELFNAKSINSLPEIFPLNKSCWLSLQENYYYQQYILDANFYNKLLLFDLKKNIKSMIIYCLFFLDDKNQLRQGYLQIKDKNNENKIINTFTENEPLQIFKNNNINIDNKKLLCHSNTLNYDLLIFQYDNENYKDINIKNLQSTQLNCHTTINKNPKIEEVEQIMKKMNKINNNNKIIKNIDVNNHPELTKNENNTITNIFIFNDIKIKENESIDKNNNNHNIKGINHNRNKINNNNQINDMNIKNKNDKKSYYINLKNIHNMNVKKEIKKHKRINSTQNIDKKFGRQYYKKIISIYLNFYHQKQFINNLLLE